MYSAGVLVQPAAAEQLSPVCDRMQCIHKLCLVHEEELNQLVLYRHGKRRLLA